MPYKNPTSHVWYHDFGIFSMHCHHFLFPPASPTQLCLNWAGESEETQGLPSKTNDRRLRRVATSVLPKKNLIGDDFISYHVTGHLVITWILRNHHQPAPIQKWYSEYSMITSFQLSSTPLAKGGSRACFLQMTIGVLPHDGSINLILGMVIPPLIGNHYTFPPIIMKWKMGLSNNSFLSFGVVFHFHDYGKKGNGYIKPYKYYRFHDHPLNMCHACASPAWEI